MNRKDFMGSMATVLAAGQLQGFLPGSEREIAAFTIPRYLRPGSTIGITSPAGFITAEEIAPSVKLLHQWGFNVRTGKTIGRRDFTFGGTDEERAADFQELLDDASIDAILCARGGYGSVRIVDRLNWEQFTKRPKWIIGFSDITVIHGHLCRNLKIASIHSKMCNSFPDDWAKAEPIQIDTILSIRQALTGEKMKYNFAAHPQNRAGTAEGLLVGGNLKTIESLAGTASDYTTQGKLLFVEDTGEYLYSLDRMFWNLERTGKLSGLKGLIIGGFKVKADDAGEEFGRNLQEIILSRVRKFNYPVCFDFPVGHQKNNFAVKCGVRHRMEVNSDTVHILELP